MRKLIAFMQTTIDGYFASPTGDMSWAHRGASDREWKDFVEGNASGGGELVFGRKTYEMMVQYWPTPQAAERSPLVAERMNALPKIVFSRTLERASWRNTRLVKGDLVAEMRKLKTADGPDMAILGSGSIVKQLAEAGLIDEFQIVVNPLALGGGQSLFGGVGHRLPLRLMQTRSFANGNVLLRYAGA